MWLLIKYIRWNIWFCYNFWLKFLRYENGTWARGAIRTRKETNKALKPGEQTQGHQWIYQNEEVWGFNWQWRKTKSGSVHLERLLDFRKGNSRSIWRWQCRSSWEWETQWVRIETLLSLCCQIAFSHLLEDLVLSSGTAELESQGQSCGYGVKIFMINIPRGGGRLILVHDVRGFRPSWWGERVREVQLTLCQSRNRERDKQEGPSEIWLSRTYSSDTLVLRRPHLPPFTSLNNATVVWFH